jgi:enhancing lycopene biosynthesis protein 2
LKSPPILAVKSHITSSEYSKSKNIEFIAAKIQLSKQKPLIIGSYYRPPNKTDDIYINGRFGALKSDSTHHFFRNACTKSGSLRFLPFPVVD